MKTPRKPRTRDLGTPELQAKRLASVVNIYTGKAGNPEMAQSTLGRYCERGILDAKPEVARRMYDAGQTVLAIWRAVFPSQIGSTLGQFAPSGTPSLDSSQADFDRKSIVEYFGPTRTMTLTAVIDCCFHDKEQQGGKLKKLRRGLQMVIDWQKQKTADAKTC